MLTELSGLDSADWVGMFFVILLVWVSYALLLGRNKK